MTPEEGFFSILTTSHREWSPTRKGFYGGESDLYMFKTSDSLQSQVDANVLSSQGRPYLSCRAVFPPPS